MNRATAKKMTGAVARLNDQLNRVALLIETIPDMSEKKAFRRSVATMMIDSHAELMRPIVKQYPELDPDKDS